LLVNRPG